VLFYLFLGWYGSHFVYDSLVDPTERTAIVAWALVEAAFVVLIFLAVLAKNLTRSSAFAVRSRGDKHIFWVLGAWLGVTLVAAGLGFWHGNDTNYLLGDLYKFASFSIVLTLFYFSNQTAASFQKLLRGFVVVYGALLIVDALRFGDLMKEEVRLAAQPAFYAGVIAPLVIYLMLYDPKRSFRIASRAVLLGMIAMMVAAQMFTPIIALVLCFGLFLLPTKKASIAIGLALAVGALFISVYYADAVLNTRLDYLESKVQLARSAYSVPEFLEDLSGVRVGEIVFVLENMRAAPEAIPFGAGLGAIVAPVPIARVGPAWQGYRHYLHAGLNEILYRGGCIGLGVFLLLMALLVRRGYQLCRNGHPFGLLLMVGMANSIILMSFACDLTTIMPLLAVCFSGLGATAQGAVPGTYSRAMGRR
jgi:hypothetical protein